MVSLSPFAALVCLLAPSLLVSKTTSLGGDDHVSPSRVTIEYFHFIDEETETKKRSSTVSKMSRAGLKLRLVFLKSTLHLHMMLAQIAW